ncbi:MAG: hypothetical protein ACOH16_10710 [Propionibacteriaceae bacterium]
MSDPLLEVDVDGHPVDVDAVVAEPAAETWLVKSSEPRWQVWCEHNRRRPPSRAEKRGRVAAATAGTNLGVLAVGGLASYAIQWQDFLNRALDDLRAGSSPFTQIGEIAGNPTANVGLLNVVNGEVVAWTPNAARPAADTGLAATIGRSDKSWGSYSVTTESWFSLSSACVYEINPVEWSDGKAAVVRVVDLTGAWDRMNGGYLTYGLVGLGVAGAAGGAVWWGLGRRLNRKVEPEVCEPDLNLT